MTPKEEYYRYGESLGISINDLQRLKMLADNCQEDMADKKYTEEEVIELLQKALTHQNDAEIGSLVTTQKEIRPANFYSWFNKFKKPLNKQY